MPHVVAALVLAVAGVAKLRSPRAAADAIKLPVALVRAFAAGELILAGLAVVTASLWSSVLMAVLYAGFAVLTLRLVREGSSCGCFGAQQYPASAGQSLLSTALAVISALGAVGGPQTASEILSRPAGTVAVLSVGAAAAAYGIVLAYSELPQLWRSWSTVG